MPVKARRRNLSLKYARLTPSLRADVLVIPVIVKQGAVHLPRTLSLPKPLIESARTLAGRHHASKQPGSIDDIVLPAGSPFARLALVGLGEEEPAKAGDVRTAAAITMEWTARHRAQRIAVAITALTGLVGSDAAASWVEGAALSTFRFQEHRTQLGDDPKPPVSVLILATSAGMTRKAREAADAALVLAECANLARSLGHEPPNVLNPVTLARRVQAISKRHRLRVRVIDERQMRAKKMGAVLAVGCGSAVPPRIIVMEHRPAGARGKPVVLVGKAITHDTGGYSIKPTASMVEMKYDKCGGMAVIGALVAAARLKIRRHVIGVIGAADNAISGAAYRPSDIIRAGNGKTIEVLDTDAEGRLVLADCLHYAETTYNPAVMIDLATLTGACSVALGDACAGLLTPSDGLAEALLSAGERTGERLWRLPLWPVYREQIAGVDADLKNVGGRLAGTITAAMFLKEFVTEKTPWAHLDIAGVANSSKALPTCPIGATGFGVRLLVDYLRRTH